MIAGRWRGRRLQAPNGEAVRPTTDRTKEALFNILGAHLPGSCFLDLCCGAGGLGIEALSRGAAHVVFVDRSAKSLAAVEHNLKMCGAEPDSFRLVRSDAEAWLRQDDLTERGPCLVVCDPPYPSDVAAAMIAILGGLDRGSGLTVAAVEYGQQTPGVSDLPPGWRERRYGATRLAIYRTEAIEPRTGGEA